MIKEYELYHGAVLARLVGRSKDFIYLRGYPSNSNSSYIVNEQIGLYIKYSTNRCSPWRFTLNKTHQDEISEMKKIWQQVFLVLACETDGIVVLEYAEVSKILNKERNETQWLSASRRPREQYLIKGPAGRLDFKVAESSFPSRIYSELDPQS